MKLKNHDEPSLNFIPHSRPTLGEEEVKAVADVIKSGHIAEGKVVQQFEEAFAERMGVGYAAAVSSGSAALHLALMAMGIGPGDEVIIPSFVCTALLHAVRHVGAIPVLADIDPLTFNIDPADVKKRVTARCKAIIVPHMFGLAADLDKLLRLEVPIIEDCAQAVGGTYHKEILGTLGNAAIFSFYATKVMATGEGGMVTSSSSAFMQRVKDLRTYDHKPADHQRFNYKMTDIQAALGQAQLARLDDFIERRRKIARKYIASLRSSSLKLPDQNPEHIYYRFVVGLKTACDPLLRRLTRQKIGCARPVYLPIHRQLKMGGYTVTDTVWETSLSIPIYPSLSADAFDRILSVLNDAPTGK